MVTEHTKLNENLEGAAARTAQPTKRVKSKKQSFEVPADVQKQVEQEKPTKKTAYYEQSVTEYFRERFNDYYPVIKYYNTVNKEFDDFYNYCWDICVNAFGSTKSLDYQTASKILQMQIDSHKENFKKDLQTNKARYNEKKRLYDKYFNYVEPVAQKKDYHYFKKLDSQFADFFLDD